MNRAYTNISKFFTSAYPRINYLLTLAFLIKIGDMATNETDGARTPENVENVENVDNTKNAGNSNDDSGKKKNNLKRKLKKKWSLTRFIFKSFGWLFAIILLIVIGLLLVAEFAHDKVVKMALPSVQNIINAPVDIGQTSLSFIRSFPYTTLELNDVYLGSVFKTNTKADSLVFVEKVYVSLRTEPLKNGKIEITEVEFKGATIKYLVEEDGTTSYDFLMSPSDTTPKVADTTAMGLVIDLEKLTISDITFIYDDRKLGAHAQAYIPKITAKGALSDTLIQAQVKGSVQVTNVDYESTNAKNLQMAELKIDVDYVGEDIEINDVSLSLDDILIAITGSAKIGNDIYADMHAQCDKIDLASVLKYAPDGMLDELGIKKVEGQLNFAADIKGNVTDSVRYPHVDAVLGFKNGAVEMADMPKVKNIGIDLAVTTGKKDIDETIGLNLKNFHFETNKSNGTIKVTASNINRPRYNVDGQFHVAMSEVVPFIPDSLGISRLVGSADLSLNTTGIYTGDINDAFIEKALQNTKIGVRLNQLGVTMDSVITVDSLNLNVGYDNYAVNISNTNVCLPDFNLKVDDFGAGINIGGSIFDLNKTIIDLNKLYVVIDDSRVDLDAKVSNLNNPTYEAALGVNVSIDNFKQFFPDSLAHSITGGVAVNVNSHGTVNLDSIEQQMFDLIINNTDIGVNLNNISADMYDPTLSFSGLGGNIKVANDSVCVNKIDVDWQGLKLHLDSTVVENVIKIFALEQNENTLRVVTKVSLDEFDYAWVERTFPTDTTTQAKPESEPEPVADIPDAVPQDSVAIVTDSTSVAVDSLKADEPYSFLALGYPVDVKGMFKLGHLQYEKASINNIQAKFSLNDTVGIIEHLKMDAFNGAMDASVRAKFKSDELIQVYFRTNFDKMDINKLLADFNSFDQTMVTENNLSGTMTADLDGYVEVLNMGDSIPFVPIKVLGRMKLEDGEIKDMEVLKTLDNFVNMRELDDIKFQTLETSLFVRHGYLYLPQTDIKSSAMNLSLIVMQGMANDNFEYHIKIFPGEIMLGNSKGVMKKQSQMKENLADEENMKSINLVAYDINGDSKYWFDTETRKKKMRTRIKVQQKQLELGFSPRLVKYDSGVKFQ